MINFVKSNGPIRLRPCRGFRIAGYYGFVQKGYGLLATKFENYALLVLHFKIFRNLLVVFNSSFEGYIYIYFFFTKLVYGLFPKIFQDDRLFR